MSRLDLSAPDDQDLVEFFGCGPKESAPTDGYWLYEATDETGVTLAFSFSVPERSIQTVLSIGGDPFVTVSHELATSIRVDRATGELVAEFHDKGSRTELRIRMTDRIRCTWATLAV